MLSRKRQYRLVMLYIASIALLLASVIFLGRVFLYQNIVKITLAPVRLSPVAKTWLHQLSRTQHDVQSMLLEWVQRSHVTLSDIRFDKSTAKPLFKLLPVFITISGTYQNTINFLFEMTNSKLIFTVKNVALSYKNQNVSLVISIDVRAV